MSGAWVDWCLCPEAVNWEWDPYWMVGGLMKGLGLWERPLGAWGGVVWWEGTC